MLQTLPKLPASAPVIYAIAGVAAVIVWIVQLSKRPNVNRIASPPKCSHRLHLFPCSAECVSDSWIE